MQVSLLLAHGHSEAASYPVGMVTDEASIVVERLNLEAASKAILHQAALGTVPNMGMKPSTTKRAASSFRKLIDKLTGAGND